jgi:SAM-dependent methyltransferase
MGKLRNLLKRIKPLRNLVISIREKMPPPSSTNPYHKLRMQLEWEDRQSVLERQELLPLHKKLNKFKRAQIAKWNSFVYCDGYYYQGYKRIGIHGVKPTEVRIQNYGIMDYLSKKKSILDIGSNAGFMSCFLSEYVKDVDAVELNPYLVKMGVATAQFLKISNISFLNGDFTQYQFTRTYDIVFSLSNHFTIDGNLNMDFDSYIQKIFKVMNKGGILFFESHSIDGDDKDLNEKFEIASKYFSLKKYKMVKCFFPQDIDKLFAVFQRLDNPGQPQKRDFDLQVARHKYEY